jgi:polyhydroxyalkanoate synthesis repressor PhaR
VAAFFFLTFMVRRTILGIGMKIIRRYKNRRLYDSEASRVITQSDLAAMVKEQVAFKVVDTATGKDVTLAVLGRVMLTETSSWENIRQSRELFSELISLGGDRSMSLLKNTVLASIGALHVTKEKAEKIIDDLIRRGELDKSDRKKAVMELLEKAEKSTTEFGKKVSKEASKAQKEVVRFVEDYKLVKQTDFKKLQAKVDKLARAISKLEKKFESA